MEVTKHRTPKKLHHHALPIVIIAVAVLVVSAPFVLQQSTMTGNGLALVHDLFTRPLQVTPTGHGLAHITLNNNDQRISPEVSQAGRTAELEFTLDRSKP
jgi:hypothetical protein